jgi:hypothetical protein
MNKQFSDMEINEIQTELNHRGVYMDRDKIFKAVTFGEAHSISDLMISSQVHSDKPSVSYEFTNPNIGKLFNIVLVAGLIMICYSMIKLISSL